MKRRFKSIDRRGKIDGFYDQYRYDRWVYKTVIVKENNYQRLQNSDCFINFQLVRQLLM